ncbi:aldo/keto reductase [Caulobacter segnis]|uniref:aldo/keto reductase n=1 Tax=Caulobacter segnis TaxID=88688 RepID=UPI00241043F9|nr:aldo/keto reductase [Caulobacter segnis]MDG2522628.1 aldo/keto reductase [Caulobacter segnis]
MRKRPLGRSGLSIAPLMFGGNVFGWTADEATSFALLDAFVDGGFDAIDTADVYSAWVPGHVGGESEMIIGKWLKNRGRRDDVIIATKVAKWPKHPGLSAANIIAAAEGSLQRLQTDVIDLYQSHEDDEATPIDETLEAYDRLIKAGKVRAIGASNFTAPRLTESLKVAGDKGLPRYETLQPGYNLYDRSEFESGLEVAALENQIGVICYYGLASGFLTGKYRAEEDLGKSPRGRGVKKYLDARGLRILDALDSVSAELGATQAQVALAWLMARPSITAPIASATSVGQLNDLMGAARLSLSAEQVLRLDTASAL